MRILLVEDDALLGDGIRAGLQHAGYTVDWFTDGLQADAGLRSEEFDVLILDLNLPRRSGLEILRKLRKRGNTLPVLILTARDTIEDRVQGLDAGADDYLVKPFDLDELTARVRALLRRSKGRSEPKLVHGSLVVDPAAHTVELDDEAVELPPREFALLELLLENTGKVQSRHKLEQALYGWTQDVDSNVVEVHIHHLRKKLGSNLIRTVRGVGYVIDKVAP
jgi:two-component system response regulator QseB